MLRKALLAIPIAALLPIGAAAEDIVPNTIDCAAFKKLPDGSWQAEGTTTFDAGAASAIRLSNRAISRRTMDVGGADLFQVIEAKCGKR